MHVATLRQGGRDGTLAVITPAGDRAASRPGGIATFQAALDDWETAAPLLARAYGRLLRDEAYGEPVSWDELLSPLPRAYEWCEASSYLPHMERMRASRGMTLPPGYRTEPILYQAGAGRTLAPGDPIPLPDASWGLDLEVTPAVITGDVPIGATPDEAAARVLFVVVANDLTYRNLLPAEFARSVGPYQSKPARPFAPMAVSPGALGQLWDGRMLHATAKAWINGVRLGSMPTGRDHAFDFGDVLARVARTRALTAGSIVGLGTVSSRDPGNGFGCVGEKRAVEIVDQGAPRTAWLTYGDTLRIDVAGPDDRSLFGPIAQTVVRPGEAARR